MRKLRPIYLGLLITLSCCHAAWADTFIVTSALASGTGSLREAIEKANANGTGVTDYIHFDLPTRRGPATILLAPNSPLPALTSNIVIDGTTQPGAALGVTDAKVTIVLQGFFNDNSRYHYIFQAIGVQNIQLYGLFLWAQVGDRSTGSPPQHLYGIHLRNVSNIIIGSPGKGNLISGWPKAVYSEYLRGTASHHITVQSNIMGFNTDGVSTLLAAGTRPGDPGVSAVNDYCLYFSQATDVFIGGENASEGNRFNGYNEVFCQGNTDPAANDSLLIIHNQFGIDSRNDMAATSSSTAISIQEYANPNATSRATATLLIRKNYIAGRTRSIGIGLSDIQGYFAIEQNQLGGEQLGGPIRNTSLGIGMVLGNCTAGIIGDTKAGKENLIRYCTQMAVLFNRSSNITFRYNSTYCNTRQAVRLFDWAGANGGRPQPFVTINGIDQATGTIRGTALPNSTIDLYADDDCPACEAKTHLNLVTTADAAGRWTYTHASLTGTSIVATATDPQGATSEYSAPLLDDRNLQIKPVNCSGPGSICGLKIISGANWEWRDEQGSVVGRDTCLNNIPAGTYTLWLPVGPGSCQEEYTFVVPDNPLAVDSSAGIVITHARCNKSNGSICGIKPVGAVRFSWEDAMGNTVGTAACLSNVPPGNYRFRVSDGTCDKVTRFFSITNTSPDIDATNLQVTATTCLQSNGSIRGITLTGTQYASLQWINELRATIGSSADLLQISAGHYKLILLDGGAGCGDSTTWIDVAATPAPMLLVANQQVNHATCNQANGSILHITTANTTGLVFVRWNDEHGQIVGNDLQLRNVKAGKYQLKMKDRSSCDTVVSSLIEVRNNGTVLLDSSALAIQPAGCTKNNGSITGMQVQGATSWEWRNLSTNQPAGNSEDIYQLPAGTYQLTAVNGTYGCRVQSHIYTVGTAPGLPVSVTQAAVKQPSCNLANGAIDVGRLTNDVQHFSFRWLRDSTTAVGTGLIISDLDPATYYLVATDTNGCEQSIYKAALTMQPMPALDETAVRVQPDKCGFSTGSITGMAATSAAGALQYQWFNSNGNSVAQQPTLVNQPAGNYYLQVTDINGCRLTSQNYLIEQVISTLPAPQYTNLTIVRHSDATLQVKDPVAGAVYTLQESNTQAIVDKNQTGIFTLKRISADALYYIMYEAGPCSSELAQVSIKVIDNTQLEIPNTFTPNNDGIHDEFRIGVTGYFKLNTLKIFNRWGQLVFGSNHLNNVWNGKKNGQNVPIGTYYWVLDGIDQNNKLVRLSGSVTVIR